MINEVLRLVLILAVAYIVYEIFQNYSKATENEGTVSVSDGFGEEEEFEAEGEMTQGTGRMTAQPTKKVRNSQIEEIDDNDTTEYDVNAHKHKSDLMKNNTNVLPYSQPSNNFAPQADLNQQYSNSYQNQQVKLDCFPKDQLNAADLLPREDGYNTWQEVNPQVQGHLSDRNFLESGHHFGINTVGQSLKNPNLGLRSDPPIPQVSVGPWLQSTYESDTNRRNFEIGADW
jgi:hypothetical protein